MFDSVALHVDLEREQQGEQELVFLIKPPGSVLVHLEGHVLDDVGDPLACNWTLCGPFTQEKDFRLLGAYRTHLNYRISKIKNGYYL